MVLNKYSSKSDEVANLYRAAFYMAKGKTETALDFLQKTNWEFPKMDLEGKKNQLLWAEKILDRYHKLKQKNVRQL